MLIRDDGLSKSRMTRRKPPSKKPSKRTTAKTTRAVAKKKKVVLPGYKVPKSLLKSTTSTRMSGGAGTFADVKKTSTAAYKAAQAKKKTPAGKSSGSDWDRGSAWMDKQFGSVKEAGRKVSKKGKKKGSWWNPFD